MQDITTEQARSLLGDSKPGTLTVLDVRQDWEYEEGHLPGAVNIPLAELPGRLHEVPGEQAVLAYCRSGGRSRAGAMLLDSNGHSQVLNMVGGFMNWNGEMAIGPVNSGLESILSVRSVGEALRTAYAMESFLQQFYLRLRDASDTEESKEAYDRLAGFEDGHMRSLYERYSRSEAEPLSRADFSAQAVPVVAEGGVAPDAFLAEHAAIMQTAVDVISMAMLFEAQALDFYQRAARAFENEAEGEDMTTLMNALAAEEQAHLKVLASFMDKQAKRR